MEFQIYDYKEDHEYNEVEDEEEKYSHKRTNKKKYIPSTLDYIIHVFGRTMDGQDVYCKLTGYKPNFYIKLPESWNEKKANTKLSYINHWLKEDCDGKVFEKYRKNFLGIKIVKFKEAIGFTNDKIFLFAQLEFRNIMAMKSYARLFENNEININGVSKKPIQYKLYESNIETAIRCFHYQDISGCSWVRLDQYDEMTGMGKQSYCDIEIHSDYTNIYPIEKDCNAPIIIASFDIECVSCDDKFPQARRPGDKIIQIGTTYTYIGESTPFRQHIVCLNKTSDVEGAITESYTNEKELVLGWKRELLKSKCDVITGYNIFGFDEIYIYDRCSMHLNLLDEAYGTKEEEELIDKKNSMSYLSKLKNYKCKFMKKELSSSALGQNKLNLWDTPGIVHIDLMKEVQKTFNLESYKLDSVASNFIKGKINCITQIKSKKTNKYKLQCDNIDDIFVEDYIHIDHVKDFVSDLVGHKYYIYKINKETKTLYIKTDTEIPDEYLDELEIEGSIYWTQAKDDVTAKDIFRLQDGDADDRMIVAKYCVKDCRLVSLLMNKLEIVTKSIEMANVCYVPMAYLFLRGQGVKLFSLTLKAYRRFGYLFPTQKKPEGENEGYEGAIVFDPVPGVYYEALVTKDYASLYPSSIIHKNMSHETIVMSSDYDRLDGIEYYNAYYKKKDGSIVNIRFAKKNNELGVVPYILDTLLKERKAVKRQMKTETNPFKLSILDAKQLALKITANSLYGQLGAPTSPILMKAIAACTTSTGREMLMYAKKYDEEVLPPFMNGLKYAYQKDKEGHINMLLDMNLKKRDDEEFIIKLRNYIENDINNLVFQPVIRYGDTDSVFTSFRFFRNCELVSKVESLDLWKRVMNFSRDLMGYFLNGSNKLIWNELHDRYYGEVNKLEMPYNDDYELKPEHWRDEMEQSNEIKIKRLLKEYMDRIYLPWLWTLQELFRRFRHSAKEDDFRHILNIKLWEFGCSKLIEMMIDDDRLLGEDLYEKKADINRRILSLNKQLKDDIELRKNYNKLEDEEEKKKLEEELLSDIVKEEINSAIELEEYELGAYNEKIDDCLSFENLIENFINDVLMDYIIEPYTSFSKNREVLKIKVWRNGELIMDRETLDLSIDMGILSGETVKKHLPFPHDLEYEKTFYPFMILKKKKYVGNKYEFDKKKYKLNYMGIVLKRRDNIPIVKEVCSNIIRFLLNDKDTNKAIVKTKEFLRDMFSGKFNINYFTTSKTLKEKESYKDWTKIAHVVLADRIAIRNPGNKPQSGDRLAFVPIVVENKTKDTLQGDLIETPDYIMENNLEIDYLFCMTNQIMKPAVQFLDLVCNNAEDEIFNGYIYMDKLNSLRKEQNELIGYFNTNCRFSKLCEYEVDYENYYEKDLSIDELRELMEEKKKIISGIKSLNRKLDSGKLETPDKVCNDLQCVVNELNELVNYFVDKCDFQEPLCELDMKNYGDMGMDVKTIKNIMKEKKTLIRKQKALNGKLDNGKLKEKYLKDLEKEKRKQDRELKKKEKEEKKKLKSKSKSVDI